MSKLNLWKTLCAMFLLCAATAIALQAQSFKTLHSFDLTDGQYPYTGLVQAVDGHLYGMTNYGGSSGQCSSGCGTVFRITPGGTLTTLYSFCVQFGCADGLYPWETLIQATDGSFYGTTEFGGANTGCTLGCGTIFKVSPNGSLTTLYSFCSQIGCADGDSPAAPLVEAIDGSFYGSTAGGGNPYCAGGCGTVFRITSSGMLTTLHSFDLTDGAVPAAGLIQGIDGNFYGTTSGGGRSACYDGCGTVFRITPGGVLTRLYSFCSESGCTDGDTPYAELVQGSDGTFYGTTSAGGTAGSCSDEDPSGCGTVFNITSGGTLATLYRFCSQRACTDGANPEAGLIQAIDGNLYGTTYSGGNEGCFQGFGCGTVFRITLSGTLMTLHSFDLTDGGGPRSPLLQDTNGRFYGTTLFGGASASCGLDGCGTVFGLFAGLDPFVEALPNFGKAGNTIKILGTNLTGATSVTFNGTPATFIVEAPSFIKATVPAGATTGTIQMVTPSGTLSSNVPFRVAP